MILFKYFKDGQRKNLQEQRALKKIADMINSVLVKRYEQNKRGKKHIIVDMLLLITI